MRNKRNGSTLIFVIVCFNSAFTASFFDLTVESIKDSASLFEKIKQPGDPLYSYFSKGKTPTTRSDIIAVVNYKILPNPNFVFEATKLSELKTDDRYEELGPGKKDEVLAKNRDLLTELYPQEIAPRNKESIKQAFGIKIPVRQADSSRWLKAEVVNFLNEVIGNERILGNWKNIRSFFGENISDKEIELFAEAMRTHIKKKIPVNAIVVERRRNDKVADVLIKNNDRKASIKLFTVSFVSGGKWKLLQIDNIHNDLLQAGYISKKEVRQ